MVEREMDRLMDSGVSIINPRTTWIEPGSFVESDVLIEPGVIKTAIMAKNIDVPNETGAYDRHYQRLLDFYMAGLTDPAHPSVVAETIYESVVTDAPKLRWHIGWGADELTAALDSVPVEDWIALGAIDDDAEYRDRFSELFGLDIRIPADGVL